MARKNFSAGRQIWLTPMTTDTRESRQLAAIKTVVIIKHRKDGEILSQHGPNDKCDKCKKLPASSRFVTE